MPSLQRSSHRAPRGALPGFLAIGGEHREAPAVLDAHAGVTTAQCGETTLAYWGLESITSPMPTLPLSRVARTERGDVSLWGIVKGMRDEPAALTSLLPPFAAVRGDERGVTMVADSMGFRQLYHSTPGQSGLPVLSTSALFAGWAREAGLNHTAVAVQSLLGWQLDQRTLFNGVDKLEPDAVASLGHDGVQLRLPEHRPEEQLSLEQAVPLAAELLRASLNALLDDHPDAVLQLTGGQDSRLLLSAIPLSRRRGLRAMTLGVSGSGDVEVAAQLADRYGLHHEVHGLGDLDGLSAAEAWELAQDAAIRLDGMSDPLALAALTVAEGNFDQGVRISGLGGEVARGFYYLGRVREREFSHDDVGQLAAWRMFVNEAVEPGMLVREFSAWARATAESQLAALMAESGREWFRATDELYLRHRMQRWAGVTDTAVGFQRTVINPMLCQQFLSIASRLAPEDKARSRFLARLQMELDPELGRIPLEGRPPPIASAYPGPWRSAVGAMSTGRRLVRKAGQRILGRNRAPAGGSVLARKVVEQWRQHPEMLSLAALSTFVDSGWIEAVLAGRIEPRPSSVALVTNLIVAGRGSEENFRRAAPE